MTRARQVPPRVLVIAGMWAVLAIAAIPFVYPFIWMATASLLPNNEIFVWPLTLWGQDLRWENYLAVFDEQPFAQQYWNSLYISSLATAGTLVVASLAGYAFARIRFPGQNILFAVILAGLLLPQEVTIIPLFRIVNSLGWIDTHFPLILFPIFGAPSVFAIFLMRQAFLVVPKELEEAGMIDGLNRFGLFARISLPLVGPSLAAVTILTFLKSWDSYLEPLVFLTTKSSFTIPLALTQYTDPLGDPIFNLQFAASTLTVLPVLIVFIMAQKYFVEGLSGAGLKG